MSERLEKFSTRSVLAVLSGTQQICDGVEPMYKLTASLLVIPKATGEDYDLARDLICNALRKQFPQFASIVDPPRVYGVNVYQREVKDDAGKIVIARINRFDPWVAEMERHVGGETVLVKPLSPEDRRAFCERKNARIWESRRRLEHAPR